MPHLKVLVFWLWILFFLRVHSAPSVWIVESIPVQVQLATGNTTYDGMLSFIFFYSHDVTI